MKEVVYLTGFMGSGKSTIGQILANVMGWAYYDLDELIEQDSKLSIPEIFENYGEAYFRKKETEILFSAVKDDKIIISLGGGTILNEENFNFLKRTGLIVYLKSSPESIYKRLRKKMNRPLIKDLVLSNASKTEFIEKIIELLEQREKFYEKADLICSTDNFRLGITVDEIYNKINNTLYENYKSKIR